MPVNKRGADDAFGDTRRPGERIDGDDDDVEGHSVRKMGESEAVNRKWGEGITNRKWGEGASDDDVEGHARLRREPEGDSARKRGELGSEDARARSGDDVEGHARLRREPEGDSARKRGEGASDDVEGHGTAKR